jgi:hypothetical protein
MLSPRNRILIAIFLTTAAAVAALVLTSMFKVRLANGSAAIAPSVTPSPAPSAVAPAAKEDVVRLPAGVPELPQKTSSDGSSSRAFTGWVVDEGGKRLANQAMTVFSSSSANEGRMHANTDHTGHFAFALPEKDYARSRAYVHIDDGMVLLFMGFVRIGADVVIRTNGQREANAAIRGSITLPHAPPDAVWSVGVFGLEGNQPVCVIAGSGSRRLHGRSSVVEFGWQHPSARTFAGPVLLTVTGGPSAAAAAGPTPVIAHKRFTSVAELLDGITVGLVLEAPLRRIVTRPAADRIALVSFDGHTASYRARAIEDGLFEIALPSGRYRATLSSETTRFFSVVDIGAEHYYTLETWPQSLPGERSIEVRVLAEGSPVAGAAVEFISLGACDGLHRGRSGRTDKDGKATVEGLLESEYRLVSTDQAAAMHGEAVVDVRTASAVQLNLTRMVQARVEIEGLECLGVDSCDEGDLHVLYRESGRSWRKRQGRNPDRMVLEQLQAGRVYDVLVVGPWWAGSATFAARITAEPMPSWAVVVEAAEVLRGRVTDETGTPLGDAVILVEGAADDAPAPWRCLNSSESGGFLVPLGPSGRVGASLRIEKTGYEPTTMDLTTSSSSLEVVLKGRR